MLELKQRTAASLITKPKLNLWLEFPYIIWVGN